MSVEKYFQGKASEMEKRVLIGDLGYEIVLNAKGYQLESRSGGDSDEVRGTFDTIADIADRLNDRFEEKYDMKMIDGSAPSQLVSDKDDDEIAKLSENLHAMIGLSTFTGLYYPITKENPAHFSLNEDEEHMVPIDDVITELETDKEKYLDDISALKIASSRGVTDLVLAC